MRWQQVATLRKVATTLPFGYAIYRSLQRRFGRLKPNPWLRGTQTRLLLDLMTQADVPVVGARGFEVGTGYYPMVPSLLYLCGFQSSQTVDLQRLHDEAVFQGSLQLLAQDEAGFWQRMEGAVDRSVANERFAHLRACLVQGTDFREVANIVYEAPSDASKASVADESIDVHYSITVFEHIPASIILKILQEASRMLRPGGVAVHLVDLGDHFQHHDKSIPSIHFLRYSEEEWNRVAGNPMSYCNRIRASELVDLFEQAGFEIVALEKVVDDESLQALRDGFPLHQDFLRFEPDDLCTRSVRIAARKPF
jgi:SAM-dependent methyltransferase